jgi:hypothetical protein
LEVAWYRFWVFAERRKVDVLKRKKDEIKRVIVEYIKKNAERVNILKTLIETTEKVVKYVLIGSGRKNPFKSELVRVYLRWEIVANTKKGKKQKGIWLVATLLIKLIQVYGRKVKQFEEATLRTVLAITLGLVRMFRLEDMFSIDTSKIRFEEKKKYMVLPLRGNKVDTAIKRILAQCRW